jgi:NOL1/NOP2/fmu family ribosome biogenesis protein
MPEIEDTQKLSKIVEEQFGAKIDFKLKKAGKRKVYAYKECKTLSQPIEIIHHGVYFGKLDKKGKIRLSIEGAQLIGKKAKKNIIEVNHNEAAKWMKGENLKVEPEKSENQGYIILKWKNYYLGCGELKNGIIRNYVPKDRRITTQKTAHRN